MGCDTDSLMKFRTAYLQAIAKCWNDKEYTKQFVENPLVELSKFGFNAEWSVDIQMDVSDRGEWRANLGGWIGPNAIITIWVPPPPEKCYQAAAWAKYYDEYPTYLGTKDYDHNVPSTRANIGATEGSLMGQWPDFLDVGAVTMKLFAMIWYDKQLQQEIAKEKKEIVDAIPIFQKWMGYSVPWNMDIRLNVKDVLEALNPNHDKSTKHCREWNNQKQAWLPSISDPSVQHCKNILRLHLPATPETLTQPEKPDEDIEAIALSAYNITGRQYPFTCP